jgi:3-oxoacyl-[acyl-carrier-protein] synthase-3
MGSMMANGQLRKGLLLVGDVSTKNTSYKDKSTYPLFGDAGTATALSSDAKAGTMAFNLQTDGAGYEAIIIPDGGIRNFASPDTSFTYKKIDEGIERHRLHIALDGIEVFNFSLREVAPNVKALLADQGREIGDIDFYVMHQANKLMNETVRKQLKIPAEKYPYSIAEYGNTSSASIPLTMIHGIREDLEKRHLRLLLSGFGVGLSWGSALIETDKIYCPEIIEHKS